MKPDVRMACGASKSAARESWHSWIGLCLVAGIALAAIFRGGGELYFGPFDSDLTNQFYPWRVFLCRWLERGAFPLWNPHAFSGYPVLEAQQMALLYPPAILPALWFPPRFGLLFTMASNVCIAAAATYAGLRYLLRVSPYAAFLGTVVYVFGAVYSMRVAAGHFTVAAAMGWMPLGALASFRAAGQRRGQASAGTIALAGTVNGLAILAGAPQYIIYLFWMELAAFLAGAGFRKPVRSACCFAAIWIVAASLACAQWLPSLWYLPFTGRSSSLAADTPGVGDRFALIAELMFPFPFGDDLQRPHLHLKNVWETCGYPGALALALTAGLFVRAAAGRRPVSSRVALGLCITGLGLFLAFGGTLPGLSRFREAMKARAIVAAGIAICASLGLDMIRASSRRREELGESGARRWASKAAGPEAAWAGLLLVVALACGVFAVQRPAFLGALILRFGAPVSTEGAQFWGKIRLHPELAAAGFAASTFRTACMAAVIFGLLLAVSRRRCVLPLLVIAGCLDPFAAHLKCCISKHPFQAVELPAPLVNFLSPAMAQTRTSEKPAWLVSLPPALSNRSCLLDGLWDTLGYDPLMPTAACSRGVILGVPRPHSAAEARIRISEAIGRRYNLIPWDPAEAQDLPRIASETAVMQASFATLERTITEDAAPDAGFGPTYEGAHLLAAPGGRQQEKLRMQIGAIARLPAQVPGTSESLTMRPQITPNQYDFDAELQSPAALVVRNTWLPGWEMRLDQGSAEEPLIANRWMLGAIVPSGKHTVSFRYRPKYFTAALAVSSVTAISLLIFTVRLGLRARTRRQTGCNV